MNNVRKAFHTKSLLRRMADGGIFKSVVNGVPTFTDKDRAAPDAEAYVPMAMRELPNTGIVPGGTALPQAPTAPMPAPAKLSPAPAPATTPRGAIPTAGYIAATGGFGPTTVPERRPRAIGGIGANRAEIGANRAEIGASRPAIGAMGLPLMTSVGYASGGEVRGPGGPTDDKVGPVMLSDGEYVLPADTVQAVGKETLDKIKDATHTPTNKAQRRGLLRRMADGTPTEEEKRVRAQLAGTIALTGGVPPQPAPPPAAKFTPAAAAEESSWSPSSDAAWRAAQVAPPGESTAGAIGRNLRGFGAATFAPVEKGLRYMSGSLETLGEAAKDFGGGVLGVTPAPTPAPTPATPKTPGWGEKQAPGEVRGPDGTFDNLATPPRDTEFAAPSQFTPAQSAELERLGVMQGDQLNPPTEMKFGDPVDRGAIDRPMVATGEKQINSKFYRDASGAVKEGTATLFRPATEEDINKIIRAT